MARGLHAARLAPPVAIRSADRKPRPVARGGDPALSACRSGHREQGCRRAARRRAPGPRTARRAGTGPPGARPRGRGSRRCRHGRFGQATALGRSPARLSGHDRGRGQPGRSRGGLGRIAGDAGRLRRHRVGFRVVPRGLSGLPARRRVQTVEPSTQRLSRGDPRGWRDRGGLARLVDLELLASSDERIAATNTQPPRLRENRAVLGLLALSVHAFFDFNHQIPANALLFTTMAAIAVARAEESR